MDQINKMPLPTRNALNAVTFLTGVNTSGINRDANVNGLPQSFINITLDGVGNNDQYNKSTDGFFASVTPRQDAVEAVTVTMAAGGADIGGHGAVGINFVTRSGSNQFTGSAYEYYRGARTELELLVQRAEQPAEERREAESVRLPPGRPIRFRRRRPTRRSSSSTTRSCACRTTSRAPGRCSIRGRSWDGSGTT